MWFEWEDRTLNQTLDYACDNWGDYEAVVFKDTRWTYKELRRQALALAEGLRKIGVKKGSKVGHLMTETLEWPVLHWALHRLGALLVPLNLMWTPREIIDGLDRTDVEFLVVTDNFRGRNFVNELGEVLPEIRSSEPGKLSVEKLPCLKSIISLSFQGNKYSFAHDFHQVWASGVNYNADELYKIGDEVKPDDPCLFLLTTGTTAFPKVCIHTNQTCLFGYAGYMDGIECKAGDRELIIAPNYHVAGVICMAAPAIRGVTIILMDWFEPEAALKIIEQEKVDWMFGFDAHFLMMKRVPKFRDYDISSLRATMIGSNPASYQELKEMGLKHQGNIYGFSEYVACQGYLPYRDRYREDKQKYSHGRPMGGKEVTQYKVVDLETGERLPPNQAGELCLKGPALCKGYYKTPEEWAKAIDDEGFFHSGDLGWLDEEGWVYYRGRLKETVKTGGENVSCREVEIFLTMETPWVRKCLIVPVPDEKFGEAVTALAEFKPGEEVSLEQLREFCRGKLASYKIPRHLIPVRPEEWVMLPKGDFNREAMRKVAMEKLNIGEREIK